MAKKFNMTLKAKERRQRVIKRLETQLSRGTIHSDPRVVALDLKIGDITRIQKELKTLKERI